MKENLQATGYVLWWAIVVVVIVAASTLIYYVALPAMVHRETQAARQSYGYVQTKQEQVIALLADYQKAGNEAANMTDGDSRRAGFEAQQQADVEQMRATVALMDARDVPPSVAQFLAGVGS